MGQLACGGGREDVQSGPTGFDHVVFVWDVTDKFGAPRALKIGTLGTDPEAVKLSMIHVGPRPYGGLLQDSFYWASNFDGSRPKIKAVGSMA